MKYKAFDTYIYDEDEPAMRSCPQCNSAHKQLLDAPFLHVCFDCGRYWIHGRYLDSFKSDEEMDAFLKEKLEHVK